MDKELEFYMKEYMDNINKVCVYLLRELRINTKQELMEYRYTIDRDEFNVGEIQICFHGVGCSVKGKGFYYDWDWGYGSRWCGINPVLFAITLKNKGVDKYTHKEIEEQCENAIRDGMMYKEYGLYYFVVPKDELANVNFPNEFDKMIIEHFGEMYIVERNKIVDRFLRKYNSVWRGAENYYDKYIMKFMHNNEEIYCTYFCDIGCLHKVVELLKGILAKKNVEKRTCLPINREENNGGYTAE